MSASQNGSPPASVAPAISVLIPLYDLRESLDQAIRNWRQQTLPDGQRIEIVVTYFERVRYGCDLVALGRQVDRLVPVSSLNEAVLYNGAASAATGGILLFTEPHCLPSRVAAQRTLEMFCQPTDAEPAAVVVGTRGVVVDDLSEMEERLAERETPMFDSLGPWRRAGFRGFAVRRSVFEQFGPLRELYRRFSELELALRIHRADRQIAIMSDVVIGHVHTNHTHVAEQSFAIRSGAIGQCRFREDQPLLAEELMGGLAGWTERSASYRATARVLCRSLLAELLSGHRRRLAARELLGHLPAALLGPTWDRWRSWLLAQVAARRLQSYLRPTPARLSQREPLPEAALDAFLAARHAWTRDGVSEAVHSSPLSPAVELSPTRPVTAADLDEASRVGVRELSTHDGRPARSTRPIALVRFRLRVGEYRARLELRCPQGRPLSEYRVRLYLNGRSIPAQAIPAHAIPAHAIPAHAIPAQAIPAHAITAHAIPVQSIPTPPVAAPSADGDVGLEFRLSRADFATGGDQHLCWVSDPVGYQPGQPISDAWCGPLFLSLSVAAIN